MRSVALLSAVFACFPHCLPRFHGACGGENDAFSTSKTVRPLELSVLVTMPARVTGKSTKIAAWFINWREKATAAKKTKSEHSGTFEGKQIS